ncbi:hypothetical protein GE061_001894 [Apolygus lucorum]|uniref:Pyruvate kinase n=1 Tax=Apolygus lucorum TaxID=248454 RepID=A0A6A4JIL6_APOLU|nr:hypothetical protein GE061_001894 [Apolygus lucorum]
MDRRIDKVVLQEGDTINLTTHPGFDIKGNKTCLYVDHKELPYVLKPKDKVLLDYGRITLSVRGCYDHEIVCEVVTGGALQGYADVTVIDVPLNIPYLTNKDKKDIEVLTSEQVDIIIVPHVEDSKCLDEVRKLIGVRNTGIQLMAKIDSKLGYKNFDAILDSADGVIIDRGKISVEVSTEKVMQAQKTMVAKANKAGKPVFGACEYLNSMIVRNCPTFAEATDVINAIIEGIDGLVLKEETARGEYPALAVRTLATLAREAEGQIWQHEIWKSLNEAATPPIDPAHAVVISSIEAANKAHATAIVLATTSGTSARYLAKYRPRCPVIAITRYGSVARKLHMFRAVWPLHYIVAPNPNWCLDVDLRLQFGINAGKLEGIIKPGDPLVLVSGWRQGAGFTNNIRVVYASDEEPWVLPYSPVVAP